MTAPHHYAMSMGVSLLFAHYDPRVEAVLRQMAALTHNILRIMMISRQSRRR